MVAPHDQYRCDSRSGRAYKRGAMNLQADTMKKNHVSDPNQSRGNSNQEIGATHIGFRQGVYVAEVSSVSHTVMLLIRGALDIRRTCLEASSYRNLAIFSAEGLSVSNGA
jgi:hypothetical protein